MTLGEARPAALALLLCGGVALLLAPRPACAQAGDHRPASGAGVTADPEPPRPVTRLRGAERLASATDRSRYRDIASLVHRNLHLGAHLTMAVTVGTIRAVRPTISERDLPILVAMLSDRDSVASSAAEGLLVVQGMKAVEALRSVRRSDPYAAVLAELTLRSIRDCYSPALSDRMNPELCPKDRAAHRPEDVPAELPP